MNSEREVVLTNVRGDHILLAVRDAGNVIKEFEFDYVIAGTGYEADIKRLSFLGDALRNGIQTIVGAPRLNSNFESSAFFRTAFGHQLWAPVPICRRS
jgi:hypothetical protein